MLFFLENVQYKDILLFSKITIQKDATTFITGRSGCGKSTLFKLLNGSVEPSSGVIFYEDNPLTNWDTVALRQEVILVNQKVFLFDGTIEGNFLEFYRCRDISAPPKSIMIHFLDLCSLNVDLNSNCQTMSAGERQRVFLAICLSFRPKVLLLDEPTSAIDQQTADLIFSNVKNYTKKSNASLVAICHDQTLTERYADEIVSIEQEVVNLK